MSNFDSSKIGKFGLPEPGVYTVRVVDAKVSTTQKGNEIWNITLEIIEQSSEFFGQLLFDNIVFSEKAMNRVKLIFESLGVQMPNCEREYSVDDILDNVCKVNVSHHEKYKNKDGIEKTKAVIAFDGYASASGFEQKQSEDDIPF